MTINPYEILGLSKDCTAEQIKKAYKMSAKKHHPDKGGSPKQFAIVKTAYDTLRDKKKRQDYDDYGVIDDNATQDPTEVAASRLRGVFVAVLAKIPLEELPYVDIIYKMKEEIIQKMAQLEGSIMKSRDGKEATKKVLKVVEKKLKRKGIKPNFLLELLRHGLSESDQQIFQLRKEQNLHQEMLNMLKEFSYDTEKRDSTETPAYMSDFSTYFRF